MVNDVQFWYCPYLPTNNNKLFLKYSYNLEEQINFYDSFFFVVIGLFCIEAKYDHFMKSIKIYFINHILILFVISLIFFLTNTSFPIFVHKGSEDSNISVASVATK